MIEITNLTKQKIGKSLIAEKVEQVLRGEKAKNWDISICLATCAKIRELNKKFRGKNKSTDVLSFAELEVKGNKNKVGQIIICPIKVKENAKEFGRSFQEELRHVLIHSVLHLLGYEHEKSQQDAEKMRKKEQAYS
ncbi:MAG: rRNA maturation RNase YbeY [Candidatus Pacebacteria bacterium]|nr:rRNA maturation RNase YbeY [Candidatus Paceibacterota bacterium]